MHSLIRNLKQLPGLIGQAGGLSYYNNSALAGVALGSSTSGMADARKFRIGVLGSGKGSNFVAIAEAIRNAKHFFPSSALPP